MRRTVTCEPWHVVVVPFPFTDRATTKRRPALVLSTKTFNRHGHSVLAMITSASHQSWPGDTALGDLKSAGLNTPSLVRLKVFTLDNRFITRRLGVLAARDRAAVAGEFRKALPLQPD
jgi:mRNA interferase MazF